MESQGKTVILNLNCKGGKGRQCWEKVSPFLHEQYGPFRVHYSACKDESERLVKDLVERGERIFISAGGDGCMHVLINALIAHKGEVPLSEFTIGAIGLGSSNDYHKPIGQRIEDVPIRLNAVDSILRDVAEVCYLGANGQWGRAYFVVSSSAGIVAEGNAGFNRGGMVLDLLKKTHVDLAIYWTFFRTLARFHKIPLEYRIDGDEMMAFDTSYLAVSKTNYISGMIRFDGHIRRDDGRFLVKILHDCSKTDLIRCLVRLSSGKEDGLSKLVTRYAETVEASSPEPFTLECDGETYEAERACFRIYEEKIRECI